MSSEAYEIPRHANAGVAFLGVELKDATIVIASVFLGLFAGSVWGSMCYLLVPAAGYLLNKQYLDWRGNALPGQFRAYLFRSGWHGYSRSFASSDVVFVGDAVVINPASAQMVDHAMTSLATKRSRETAIGRGNE